MQNNFLEFLKNNPHFITLTDKLVDSNDTSLIKSFELLLDFISHKNHYEIVIDKHFILTNDVFLDDNLKLLKLTDLLNQNFYLEIWFLDNKTMYISIRDKDTNEITLEYKDVTIEEFPFELII